jgi:hypothetical protein
MNFFDIKRNWVDINRKENTMSLNLPVLYEIADKAARVKSKKAYRDFEKWVKGVIQTYQDAAIERVANTHLFRLREQFSY